MTDHAINEAIAAKMGLTKERHQQGGLPCWVWKDRKDRIVYGNGILPDFMNSISDAFRIIPFGHVFSLSYVSGEDWRCDLGQGSFYETSPSRAICLAFLEYK